MMKLHIGGEEPKLGWKIVNINERPGVDFVGDIRDLSQFGDASCDEVYASHVLEHVPQKEMHATFKGIHRILKKGGKFYISVPDMDILCHLFINPLAPKEAKYDVMRIMYGAQQDPHDFHYFGWNQLFLYDFLGQTGFANAERVESFGLFNDTSNFKPFGFPISVNIVATK